MRSTALDGLLNRLEFTALTSCEPAWAFLQRRPKLRSAANKLLIDNAILKLPTRPNPVITMAPYSSWSSLIDRRFDSRHLPPASQSGLPEAERVATLFARGPETKLCPKSTVMFAYFAQEYLERTAPVQLIRTRFETPESAVGETVYDRISAVVVSMGWVRNQSGWLMISGSPPSARRCARRMSRRRITMIAVSAAPRCSSLRSKMAPIDSVTAWSCARLPGRPV